MNIWLVMVIIGVITYLYRLSFIQGFGSRELPGARSGRFRAR